MVRTNRRARRGRRVRRATRTSRRSGMAGIRRALSGKSFTPRPDPPRWSIAPWNSVVCVLLDTTKSKHSTGGQIVYKVSDVYQHLCELYGLYVKVGTEKKLVDLALRFKSIRVYSREDYSPLLVQVHSLVGEDDLAILEDIPSKMRRARIGYRWPKSFSDVTFHKTSTSYDRTTGVISDAWDDVLFTIVMQSASSAFSVYIELLWRPDCVDLIKSKAQHLFIPPDRETTPFSFDDG